MTTSLFIAIVLWTWTEQRAFIMTTNNLSIANIEPIKPGQSAAFENQSSYLLMFRPCCKTEMSKKAHLNDVTILSMSRGCVICGRFRIHSLAKTPNGAAIGWSVM
jgi:hypothetical protein